MTGRRGAASAAAWLGAALALLAPVRGHADYGVVSPDAIDYGKLLFQQDGDILVDRRPSSGGGAQAYTVSVGTGVTAWWDAVIGLGTDHAPGDGQPTRLTQVVLTSTFELTEPGESFVDASFYVEYGQTVMRRNISGANEVTFGPAFGKDIGHTTNTINLFFTRLLGPDQDPGGLDFNYAWQTRWNLWEALSPAFEIYGDAGTLGRTQRLAQQQVSVGPVAFGSVGFEKLGLGSAGRLEYELGWLFGATPATAAGALRWHVEVEIPF